MRQLSCLVTGAGRGIGRAVAVGLAGEGHRVALTARSADQLAETAVACGEAVTLVLPGDATDPAHVESAYAEVERAWGAVDVLVANAGAGATAPVAGTTDEQWQAMLDLNLTAPFRFLRRAIPGMVAQGFGRVVVLGSVASKHGEPYIAAYTASKHGVLGLVRSAAAELATKGVTVNAVCPGYVDTPMTDGTVEMIVGRTGRSYEEARGILAAKQPIGRLVTAEEVAEAVLYCVRSGAVTGQGLNVDGGAVQS
ncbi:MAG: SDR family NAD(P)-dependent oxidoreductase [Actinomycetes bacterium]